MNKTLTAVLAITWLAAGQAMATQGVTKNDIVLGSIQDMSGPLASYSKPLVNGMRMHIDEINEAGGINGRKLKLIVEDSGYDPKKGVLAAQKLVQRDQVFAVVGTIGTAVNLAAMPVQLPVEGRNASGTSERMSSGRCSNSPALSSIVIAGEFSVRNTSASSRRGTRSPAALFNSSPPTLSAAPRSEGGRRTATSRLTET